MKKRFNDIAHNAYMDKNYDADGNRQTREEYIDSALANDVKKVDSYRNLLLALHSHWGRTSMKVFISSRPTKWIVNGEIAKSVRGEDVISAEVTEEKFVYDVLKEYLDLKIANSGKLNNATIPEVPRKKNENKDVRAYAIYYYYLNLSGEKSWTKLKIKEKSESKGISPVSLSHAYEELSQAKFRLYPYAKSTKVGNNKNAANRAKDNFEKALNLLESHPKALALAQSEYATFLSRITSEKK